MKPIRYGSSRTGGLRKSILGLLCLCFLLALSSCGKTETASVHIYDNAHVLNSHQVQSAASRLRTSLTIYTTSTFAGTQVEFQNLMAQQLQSNPALIVMAIDTVHRYFYIVRGPDVTLSQAGIQQAIDAFVAHFKNDDYTSASLAAISSLQSSTNASPPTRPGTSKLFANPFVLICCLIPLLLLLFLLLFFTQRHNHLKRARTARRNF